MRCRSYLLLITISFFSMLGLRAQDLSWLGDYEGTLPNITHSALGPLYIGEEAGGGYFIYDYSAYGWEWTSSSVYPWIWVNSSVSVDGRTVPIGWVYYDVAASTNGIRLFYQQVNNDWFISERTDKPQAPAAGFTLVLEQYDSQPISGIMITNPVSTTQDNYWTYDSTTNQIVANTPTDGTEVQTYFIPWSSLPDYTQSPSEISKQVKTSPTSRKYVIVPSTEIDTGRIYVAETDLSDAGWNNWVASGQQIPAFADSNTRLNGSLVVDKVEFTYVPSNYNTLTLNTTTVDFLSIPMTVESVSSSTVTWGNQYGPVGITQSTATIAASFNQSTWSNFGGVDWYDTVVTSNSDVYRILAPFRYMDVNSKPAAWQSFFDDYLTYLTTTYGSSSIQYPIQTTAQPSNYFYGKISTSDNDWNITVYDRSGSEQSGGNFTISPSDYSGNSYALFSQANVSNDLVNDIQSAILRGIAHENDPLNGWINYYGTYFPTVQSSPSGDSWTPSLWTDQNNYYSTSNSHVRFSVYSKLIHESSIVGTRTNETNLPYPASVNQQKFDYGFPTDNIWTHDATATGPHITTATVGIFKRQ